MLRCLSWWSCGCCGAAAATEKKAAIDLNKEVGGVADRIYYSDL